jgi:hypothetical protein
MNRSKKGMLGELVNIYLMKVKKRHQCRARLSCGTHWATPRTEEQQGKERKKELEDGISLI